MKAHYTFASLSRPEEYQEATLEVLSDELSQLIVWNDDVNTFDWVIESLMDICNHTPEQAEQCTILIHYKGKCAVKKGGFDALKPMCEALIDRGISATID